MRRERSEEGGVRRERSEEPRAHNGLCPIKNHKFFCSQRSH